MRAFATLARNHRIVVPIPTVFGFGFPLALLVLTHARTGPKESSIFLPGVSKHVCTSPTKEILKLSSVLPIGVLQHPAYQRSSPFPVRRMQAKASVPWVKATLRGRT